MPDRETGLLQDAFRDLHGRALHGFALLVTVGNGSIAAEAAGRALAEGEVRAGELRHPERAAGWLRARVMRLLPAEPGRLTRATEPARRAALRSLGVTDEVFNALASMRTRDRATLVAAVIEGLDERDLEPILGRRGPALRVAVRRVRARYIAVAGAAMPEGGGSSLPGGLTATLDAEARRLMGGRPS